MTTAQTIVGVMVPMIEPILSDFHEVLNDFQKQWYLAHSLKLDNDNWCLASGIDCLQESVVHMIRLICCESKEPVTYS
jgi:hypothetical protein